MGNNNPTTSTTKPISSITRPSITSKAPDAAKTPSPAPFGRQTPTPAPFGTKTPTPVAPSTTPTQYPGSKWGNDRDAGPSAWNNTGNSVSGHNKGGNFNIPVVIQNFLASRTDFNNSINDLIKYLQQTGGYDALIKNLTNLQQTMNAL
jgi:hypothetical protein